MGARAAVDAWETGYNARRPHQCLGMQVPADRFLTRAAATRRAEAEQLLIGGVWVKSPRFPPAVADLAALYAQRGPTPSPIPAPLQEPRRSRVARNGIVSRGQHQVLLRRSSPVAA